MFTLWFSMDVQNLQSTAAHLRTLPLPQQHTLLFFCSGTGREDRKGKGKSTHQTQTGWRIKKLQQDMFPILSILVACIRLLCMLAATS